MISLIAAVAANGTIGRDNALPWSLPADMRYFRQITWGHTVLMGRRNYQDIGKALEGRDNLVLTHDTSLRAEDCTILHSIDDVLEIINHDKELFVIGGREIYQLFLPLADKLYLTRIQAKIEGDVNFPDYDPDDWIEISREDHKADANNQYDYSFLVYRRK